MIALALSVLAGAWVTSAVVVVAYGWQASREPFVHTDPADRHLEQRVSRMIKDTPE